MLHALYICDPTISLEVMPCMQYYSFSNNNIIIVIVLFFVHPCQTLKITIFCLKIITVIITCSEINVNILI